MAKKSYLRREEVSFVNAKVNFQCCENTEKKKKKEEKRDFPKKMQFCCRKFSVLQV